MTPCLFMHSRLHISRRKCNCATIVGLNLSFAFVWLEDSCGLDACVTPDLNVEALTLEPRACEEKVSHLR